MKRIALILLTTIAIFLLSACGEDVFTITTVSKPGPIIVDRGTSYSDVNMPLRVSVLLDNGTIVEVPVEWPDTVENFDFVTSNIEIEGTIINTETIVNTFDRIPVQEIAFAPIGVVETIALFPQYSIYYNALIASNVLDTLDETLDYTFLLPTNDAFVSFFQDLQITVDDFMSSDLMDDIVRSHIVEGHFSDAVLRASSPTTFDVIDDSSITVSLENSILQLNETTNIIGEMDATNGNILELDNIILPSITNINDVNDGLMTILMANLLGVITDLDLLQLVLFGDGITVFIPSEDSLITLLLQYGLTIEDMTGSEEFIEILTHHIVGEYYSAEDLYTNAPVVIENTTGTAFSITVVDGVLLIDGVRILSSTVNDDFGVIHEIDGVLLTEEMQTFLEEYEPSN